VSASPSSTTAGGSVTYSATVSSSGGTPTGTVTFTSGATTLCTTDALVEGAGSCSATNAPTGSDTITGTYSGEPGSFEGSSGTATLVVDQAPSITSANSTTFTEGTAGSFPVSATGFPSPTITESGALPEGVTFNGGVLSGTPTQDGIYTISFEAANGVGSNAVQSFTLTVELAPNVTSATSTTFTQGTAGSFTVTATGFPSPTIKETGALPNGVTFSNGVLSGTPTVTGSFPISFTATNSAGFSAQGFTLTVNSKPAITSASKATFTVGTAGSFTVTATGSPTPTIAESGALPTGVTFSGGVLSGTPTQGGVYPITFTATNGVGSGAVQSFTLTVDSPPAITSANNATFGEGASNTFTVTATGTPAPTITRWGNLPDGVRLSNGVLSGIPTQSGIYEITLTASNGIGNPSTQQFTLTVRGLRITTTSLPAATPGVPYSAQLAALGGDTPYKWKTNGGLPKGLKLSKSGLISGTVTAKSTTSTFEVWVTDASKGSVGTTLTLDVS
jgi:hypothetical protein